MVWSKPPKSALINNGHLLITSRPAPSSDRVPRLSKPFAAKWRLFALFRVRFPDVTPRNVLPFLSLPVGMVRTCLLMGVPINPRRGMLVVACTEQWKPTMLDSLQKHKFQTLTAKMTSHLRPSSQEAAPA